MQDLSKLEHEVKIISNKICMTKLPEMIIKELDLWKMECDKIKNHPLGYLKIMKTQALREIVIKFQCPLC